MSSNDHVPNFGRPSWPGPISQDDWRYPELDTTLQVTLHVHRSTQAGHSSSRDHHWYIQWPRGFTRNGNTPIHRRLQIIQERNLRGLGDLPHLTNWGALSVLPYGGSEGKNTVVVPVKVMTRQQRIQFEAIANTTPVRRPNGEWNCQDWCKTVLEVAVSEGIFTTADLFRIIRMAESV